MRRRSSLHTDIIYGKMSNLESMIARRRGLSLEAFTMDLPNRSQLYKRCLPVVDKTKTQVLVFDECVRIVVMHKQRMVQQ